MREREPGEKPTLAYSIMVPIYNEAQSIEELCDRVDDVSVVKLIEPPFLFEDLWHLPKRRLPEKQETDPDTQYRKDRRESGEIPFPSLAN